MKLVLFLMLLSFNIFALEVVSLSQGNCWLSEEDDGIKFSSFSNSLAFKVDDYSFEEIQLELSSKGLNWSGKGENNFFAHCSALGLRLVANLELESERVCSWFYFGNGGLKIQDHGLESSDSKDFCDGFSYNRLLIKTHSPEETFKAISLKYKISFKETAKDVYEVFSKDFLKIKKEFSHFDGVVYIELIGINHPVGEIYKLEKISTK